jgi:CheY-like chemotaxis protein
MTTKPVLLLIDDDEDDRDIFAIALKAANEGATLYTASNGPKAIALLKAGTVVPQLIFIDLNMPYMHGADCLREIKKMPGFTNVPAVIYTTSSHAKDVDETKGAGAAHFLVKPNSLGALTGALTRILGGTQPDYYIETAV